MDKEISFAELEKMIEDNCRDSNMSDEDWHSRQADIYKCFLLSEKKYNEMCIRAKEIGTTIDIQLILSVSFVQRKPYLNTIRL